MPDHAPKRSLRAALVRQITLWHWMSSGVCLGGMLLFTITGLTLNHAAEIPAEPKTTVRERTAPGAVRAAIGQEWKSNGRHRLPAPVAAWVADEFGSSGDGLGEWSEEEVYVSLPRPGGDAWLTIERGSGLAHYEMTSRGWIAYLNDLHKGRHTGRAWSLFIDVLAAACLIFTATGLVLLQVHAAKRPATWPLVTAGVLLPVFVLMLFAHQ
jgi:hypothetical protein